MTDHRLDVLSALADHISAKRNASAETSYTAKLISQGIETCAKKLGEEAVETALAAVLQKKTNIASETADLLYHLLVLLEATDVKLADVMDVLADRQGISGIAEKASRPKD
jgi:phosphoribosyl-ATP pyrophosphohydrolase